MRLGLFLVSGLLLCAAAFGRPPCSGSYEAGDPIQVDPELEWYIMTVNDIVEVVHTFVDRDEWVPD